MSNGLTPSEFTEQRIDAMREGVKGLFLMNGGGSVALLAFLQAIWTDDPPLAERVVFGLAFLVVGVFLAGLVHFSRVHTANALQRTGDNRNAAFRWYQRLYFSFAYASLGFFVLGMGVVLRGAWCSVSDACLP